MKLFSDFQVIFIILFIKHDNFPRCAAGSLTDVNITHNSNNTIVKTYCSWDPTYPVVETSEPVGKQVQLAMHCLDVHNEGKHIYI